MTELYTDLQTLEFLLKIVVLSVRPEEESPVKMVKVPLSAQ